MLEPEEETEIPELEIHKKKKKHSNNECNCLSCRFERHELNCWIKKFRSKTHKIHYIG